MFLTILIVSNPTIAANNRGEGVGNLQTLQRVTTSTGSRTVLSGAALKRAVRDNMLASGANMWRRNDPDNPVTNPAGYVYGANNAPAMANANPPSPQGFDDDLFGFMKAEKDKGEQVAKAKGFVEFSMALSTTEDPGDVAFNLGLKAKEPQPNPFGLERHFTRYQYTVTADLAKVRKESLSYVLRALKSLAVGGNHSSNASEITPDAVVFALHKCPGRAGLQCGMADTFLPDVEIDVTPIVERAQRIGAAEEFQVLRGGAGIEAALAAALPYCKD